MKFGIIAVVIVAIIVVLGAFYFGPFAGPAPQGLDTTTHSREVAGFYGSGGFAGELLQSDMIVTNVTSPGNMSQSIVFQGRVCQRLPGLGRVFLDGAKITEPDAIYKVSINGIVQFTFGMEVGSSSALNGCLDFVQKDFVMEGQTTGVVKVELLVYVTDFQRGAGAYEILARDQAALQ